MPDHKPTVLIVTYERIEATKRCIESVLKNTPKPLDFIFVDNCSRRELKNLILRNSGIKIFLDKNIGLYKAINLGMRVIDSEFVAFLDSDIIVTPGWWDALLNELTEDPKVGLAGSRYLNPDGSLQEGYPIISPDGWYGKNIEDRPISADCNYIAIGCSVFRRSAWETVGGFDESYFISHGDIDFCYKLRYEGGYKIRYCPKSSVIHDHEFGKEDEYEKVRFDSRIVSKDYDIFRKKWEKMYIKEAENGK